MARAMEVFFLKEGRMMFVGKERTIFTQVCVGIYGIWQDRLGMALSGPMDDSSGSDQGWSQSAVSTTGAICGSGLES